MERHKKQKKLKTSHSFKNSGRKHHIKTCNKSRQKNIQVKHCKTEECIGQVENSQHTNQNQAKKNKTKKKQHKKQIPNMFTSTPLHSWGTKERFWLTLAPENNTAKLYMVEKVIIWGI